MTSKDITIYTFRLIICELKNADLPDFFDNKDPRNRNQS